MESLRADLVALLLDFHFWKDDFGTRLYPQLILTVFIYLIHLLKLFSNS